MTQHRPSTLAEPAQDRQPGGALGIYIHIAYCRTICPYCDFVRERTSGAVPSEYMAALRNEIAAFEGPGRAGSVFLGGGTPSLIGAPDLHALFRQLEQRFQWVDPEITLEANPDDVTPEKIALWKNVGINRISLGVQSFSDEVLRYLGRRHDAHRARMACEWVAGAFPNWSMDLIFGAPPQGAWQSSLKECRHFDPPHVSTYGLTYEPGTPFERRAGAAVPDDAYLALYRQAAQALPEHQHYEISNHAKPGLASRHNLVYWRNEEYAGFGTGAYSFLRGMRARNHSSTHRYLEAPGAREEALRLTQHEIRLETLIQHLRLQDGLPLTYYETRFGNPVAKDFGDALDALAKRGLISRDETRIRPTPKGFYLNNEIGLALV